MANNITLKPSAFIATAGAKEMLVNTFADPKMRDSFVSTYLSACATNRALLECDPASSFPAFLKGASMNFSYGTGDFYIIPYKRKNGTSVAQFQLGWRAFRQLALRSNRYSVVDTQLVREGEYKGRDKLTGLPKVEFDSVLDDKKPVVGYFAFAIEKGETIPGATLFMTKEEMESHAMRYSEAYKNDKKYGTANSVWTSDFDKMAIKTVLKLLCDKKLVKSLEMQNAIKYDQSVIDINDTPTYVDRETEEENETKTTVVNSLDVEEDMEGTEE